MNYTEIVAVLAFAPDLYPVENGWDCGLSQERKPGRFSKVPEMIVILFSSPVRSRSWSTGDRR